MTNAGWALLLVLCFIVGLVAVYVPAPDSWISTNRATIRRDEIAHVFYNVGDNGGTVVVGFRGSPQTITIQTDDPEKDYLELIKEIKK